MSAAERREQLLDVATRLAVRDGFHAVSVEAIAREAGVTRAVIYLHFRDLQALLGAVIDREGARALAQVSETALAHLSEGDSRALMLESLESYLDIVRDHPTTWRLVLMPPEGAPALLRRRIEAGRRSVLERLGQAVRPALAGRDESDAELTARVLSAISDEYARLVLTDPDRYPPDRLIRHAAWWLDQPSFGL
jgi:AcrR family transcriptional regulator